MKSLRILLTVFLFTSLSSAWGSEYPVMELRMAKEPSSPFAIVAFFNTYQLPRIEFRDATFREAISYILRDNWYNADRDVSLNIQYQVDFQLPDQVLESQISISAKNVTIAEALKLVFKDTPVTITFKTGHIVFASP